MIKYSKGSVLMKKRFLIIGIIVVAVVGAFLINRYVVPDKTNTQSKKFNSEYTLLTDDNVFVYKSDEEIINVLEEGTGIIFLGFPECPWCQKYVVYLDEIAKNNNVEEIYYYNIKEIRNSNTERYKKIVALLKDHLSYDDAGKKRVYVPNVTFVKNGVILANDNETALINDGSSPEDYWTAEVVDNFKIKMNVYFEKYTEACSTCN